MGPVHVSGTQDKAYYYSTYNAEDKNPVSIEKPKVMILAAAPTESGRVLNLTTAAYMLLWR